MIQVFNKKNRILLSELVRTDFKLRYQGSTLGYMWSLLRPLFLFGILYIVFGQILKFGKDIPFYPVYLLLGIVIWNFFSDITKQGSNAIVGKGNILRKISFPKYIIVLSSSLSALINFGLNMIVVLVFIILSGASLSAWSILIAPILVVLLYAFGLSLAFILSAINVRYRDIQHIWDIVIQAGFYATPIIYPISFVVEKSNDLATAMIAFNPVAQIIQDLRSVMVTEKTQTLYELSGSYNSYIIPLGIVALTSVFAVYFFKKRARYFTEEL